MIMIDLISVLFGMVHLRAMADEQERRVARPRKLSWVIDIDGLGARGKGGEFRVFP
jgi:hypothetical protein